MEKVYSVDIVVRVNHSLYKERGKIVFNENVIAKNKADAIDYVWKKFNNGEEGKTMTRRDVRIDVEDVTSLYERPKYYNLPLPSNAMLQRNAFK